MDEQGLKKQGPTPCGRPRDGLRGPALQVASQQACCGGRPQLYQIGAARRSALQADGRVDPELCLEKESVVQPHA